MLANLFDTFKTKLLVYYFLSNIYKHWSSRGLNSGLFACKANTLPLSYYPLINHFTLLHHFKWVNLLQAHSISIFSITGKGEPPSDRFQSLGKIKSSGVCWVPGYRPISLTIQQRLQAHGSSSGKHAKTNS